MEGGVRAEKRGSGTESKERGEKRGAGRVEGKRRERRGGEGERAWGGRVRREETMGETDEGEGDRE